MIQFFSRKTIAIIVAHPDDETLWAGGTMLRHPFCKWFVVCLCRADDAERSARFYEALKTLKAEGVMGNLDDGPDQIPLSENEVEQAILSLLPKKSFDIIFTHNPTGEYTKHLRHEEISKAVITLWVAGKIVTKELRCFAYEDGNKKYSPKAIETATIYRILTNRTWLKKYRIIHKIYGFKRKSWEAKACSRIEAFWQFKNHLAALKWLQAGGIMGKL